MHYVALKSPVNRLVPRSSTPSNLRAATIPARPSSRLCSVRTGNTNHKTSWAPVSEVPLRKRIGVVRIGVLGENKEEVFSTF